MNSVKNKLWIPGLALILISCATSPTGRKQVVLLGDGQINQLGAQSFEELKKQTPIERDPKINAYVKCITNPITEAARGRSSVDSWEIVVFQDKTPNAFALPGGKIGVHTGLLPIAKNEGQLAAVIGHEVGHVIAKHGNERMSQGTLAQVIMAGADVATGGMTAGTKQAVMAGLGVGAQYGVLLPFSRAQESEADIIGLELMSKAGFDPHQSVELWRNMGAAGGGKPPEWMSTHPSDSTRMAGLSENIPKHVAAYESAKAAGRVPNCQLR